MRNDAAYLVILQLRLSLQWRHQRVDQFLHRLSETRVHLFRPQWGDLLRWVSDRPKKRVSKNVSPNILSTQRVLVVVSKDLVGLSLVNHRQCPVRIVHVFAALIYTRMTTVVLQCSQVAPQITFIKRVKPLTVTLLRVAVLVDLLQIQQFIFWLDS